MPLPVLTSTPGNSTEQDGNELPTCDPDTQPALAPNFAQLDVSVAPGASKAVDSYLCTRGNTGESDRHTVALRPLHTGTFLLLCLALIRSRLAYPSMSLQLGCLLHTSWAHCHSSVGHQ
jgi:hypothetical protein